MVPRIKKRRFEKLGDICVTVNESMFEKVNADPKRVFNWPKPTLPDGAMRDY